ncbi:MULTISPECIES: PTS system mannose/fructose/sorbose family transporter subunit IID [unclassified Luteococcus]|uniref:PTS system mannose/fructose/sorbose family transporter subunit IID n=1 Tax=unclassified Luteococcus TaxID=2639923 RepID=UPI00313CE979
MTEIAAAVDGAVESTPIRKRDLVHAWLIWENFPQTCYNYERMMGQAVAHTFVPIARRLYKNSPDEKKEMMKRESEFFNVHIEFGACILGLAIALEEQKAMGKPVPGALITSLKTSLMGPLSGIGDTIFQGVLIPILLAICIDITQTGSIWGSVTYAVAIIAIAFGLSYANFMFGYRAGAERVMEFLERGLLDKILRGAEIMGCMVMGGLISNFVFIETPLKITSSTKTFEIQTQLLDAIMPKVLPLAFTMFVYWLIKKKVSSVKIILLIVAIGVVLGVLGILGATA